MNRFLSNLPLVALVLSVSISCSSKQDGIKYGESAFISCEDLADKIKGGWAGQTIGCTFGGPTEFKYKGAIMSDATPIEWYDDYAYDTFIEDPGLYDDVYMDLTFVEVMAKYGIDAPSHLYATAFANADYKLWHANQAARYNILNGIMPPASGHWKNNPHADDIDFQIEADFIGMICPGMPNKSSEICDRIGHIMNYGDGYFGGVYMGALYSLSFFSSDIPYVVNEALRSIPQQSKLYTCISDVIKYHSKYPQDWKQCWLEIEKRHGFDVGCPEGVFNGFNIDAVINAAYVVMGLLYGEGDFFKTMDVSTRCGQDSDCNPASAAGILGVMLGYSKIPQQWKPAMERVEHIDFPYTSISLNKIYELNQKLAEDVILAQGGEKVDGGYNIVLQEPISLPFEQSFEGIYPSQKRVLKKKFQDELILKFDGSGVVVMGQVTQIGLYGSENYKAQVEAYIDDELVESFVMPLDYIKRKYDIFYKYDLEDSPHTLKLKLLNPNKNFVLEAKEMVIYKNL